MCMGMCKMFGLDRFLPPCAGGRAPGGADALNERSSRAILRAGAAAGSAEELIVRSGAGGAPGDGKTSGEALLPRVG